MALSACNGGALDSLQAILVDLSSMHFASYGVLVHSVNKLENTLLASSNGF